jgi:hypothetical protein
LLKWTIVAGLVGVFLRAIAERLKLAGRLAIWAIELGWEVAITFVIPVLLFEDVDAGCGAPPPPGPPNDPTPA